MLKLPLKSQKVNIPMGKFNSTTGYTSSKVPQAFVLLGIFFMIFFFFFFVFWEKVDLA